MSLHRYKISLSDLGIDEKTNLMQRLDSMTWNGTLWNRHQQTLEFYVDESFDISLLDIPLQCHLTRIP